MKWLVLGSATVAVLGAASCTGFTSTDCRETRSCRSDSRTSDVADSGALADASVGGANNRSVHDAGSSGGAAMGGGSGGRSGTVPGNGGSGSGGKSGGAVGSGGSDDGGSDDGGSDDGGSDDGGSDDGGSDATTAGTVGASGGNVCDSTHLDCNGDAVDGCEVDITSDADHCGACLHACSSVGAAKRACVAGVCKPSCAASYGDCSTPKAPPGDDGCETSLDLPKSCGGCGHDCLGGACSNGTCQPVTLATGLGAPGQIVVDQSYVHWTDSDPANAGLATLNRMSTDGKGVAQITNNEKMAVLASDGEFVYWGVFGTNFYSSDGFIYRVKSGSNGPVVPVRNSVAAGAMAVNATSLFWGDDANDALNQCSKDGTSNDTALLSGGIVAGAIGDDSSLWVNSTAGLSLIQLGQSTTVTITSALGLKTASDGSYLAMDSAHVYAWFGPAPRYNTHLLQFSKPNLTNPVELATATTGQQIHSAGGYVYFVDSGALHRVPVDKSTGPKPVAGAAATVVDLASNGGVLYWTERTTTPGNGAIKKLAVY